MRGRSVSADAPKVDWTSIAATFRSRRSKRAARLVDYLLLAVLIATVSIVVIGQVGGQTRQNPTVSPVTR
jgi:hypothetical protein